MEQNHHDRIFITPTGEIHEFEIMESDTMDLMFIKGSGEFTLESLFLRPALIWPRCQSSFEIQNAETRDSHEIDVYHTKVLSPNSPHKIISHTSTWHIAILLPSAELIDHVRELYELDEKEVYQVFWNNLLLSRTNWQNEIMSRYVYEKLEGIGHNVTFDFLEQELVKEIFFQEKHELAEHKTDLFSLDRIGLNQRSPILQKAINYIERNLFEPISIDEIIKASHASKSTLIRVFKEELNTTPIQFAIDRKLDEAIVLLKSKRFNISQVAMMIGYENISSFNATFKSKYKMTPSEFLKKS